MKCLNCSVEFEPKRADAKFHNGACKMAYSRNKKKQLNVTPVTDNMKDVTDNVTDKPLSVTKDVTDKLNVTDEADNEINRNTSVTFEPKTKVSVTRTPAPILFKIGSKNCELRGALVYEDGVLIPEGELNSFYRGLRGKGELVQDIVYSENFRVDPIILRESIRKSLVQENYYKASGI